MKSPGIHPTVIGNSVCTPTSALLSGVTHNHRGGNCNKKETMLVNLRGSDNICGERIEPMFRVWMTLRGGNGEIFNPGPS